MLPARRLLPLLVAAALVAACGTDADPETSPEATTATAPAPVEGTSDASLPSPVLDPAGAPGNPVAPVADVPGDGDTAPTTTVDAGTATTAPVASAPEPGPVGAYAAFYLRPAASSSIVVQVLAQRGAGPDPATVQRVTATLGDVSGKPVAATTTSLGGEAPRSWTADELRALADSAVVAQSVERAVLTLLFVRGGFADNQQAVGVAVRSDVAAVFAERIDEAAGVLGNRSAVEEAVAVHEIGHLLGLVDIVLDTGRADPEHPGHSPNRRSVMYHAVESTLLGSVLTGGPPREFDQADLDDLARIRNGWT